MKVNNRTYLDGLARGAFLATIVWLIAHMLLDFGLPNEKWLDFVGTIVVATFSLGAALIALRGVRSQIAATEQIELERRERALFAAKSILANELAALFALATNNIRLHFDCGAYPGPHGLPAVSQLIPLSAAFTEAVKAVIENADPVSQDRLANIVRHCQVFQARDERAKHFTITARATQITIDVHNAISSAIGWAVVHAMAAHAIRYTRGSCETISPSVTLEDVRSAFLQCGIHLELYPNLHQILKERAANNRVELDWSK